jgi:hypothetical protein
MGKLKSLDLKLVFHNSYNTHPITIKYKGKVVNHIDLSITKTDQKEEIHFEGFTHSDSKQKIACKLLYNGKEVDLHGITSFMMANNQYVENTSIACYTDIYFNGMLTIQFDKKWFEYNILQGANLDRGYASWDPIVLTNDEVFCVGDSYTLGFGASRSYPSMLNAFNFGVGGMSHDGCFMNIKYILENSSSVRKIICLLPGETRKLYNFEFLDSKGCIPVAFEDKRQLPKEYHKDVVDIKEFILDGRIEQDWIQNVSHIIDMCNKHGVECWLSTYDPDMWPHIPSKYRLPFFPNMNTFPERATDNLHPHEKHYELFVKNIKPYIDKKQI